MEKQYERILSNISEKSPPRTSNAISSRTNSYSDLEANDSNLVITDDTNEQQSNNEGSFGDNGVTDQQTVGEEERSPLASPLPAPGSYMRASSFGFSDDEDDDEADLKRYNLHFSTEASDRATLTNSPHGGASPSNSSLSNRNHSLLNQIWYSFQSQRQEARQRRAQLLLQQSERSFSQSLRIFLGTYCDATDRGILLVVSLVFLWAMLLLNLSNQTLKMQLFAAGFCFFALRIGARPLWTYCSKQQQRRRQQQRLSEQQLHQQLPQQSPAPKKTLRHRSNSNDSISESLENTGSPGRYLDEPNMELQSIAKSNTTSLE